MEFCVTPRSQSYFFQTSRWLTVNSIRSEVDLPMRPSTHHIKLMAGIGTCMPHTSVVDTILLCSGDKLVIIRAVYYRPCRLCLKLPLGRTTQGANVNNATGLQQHCQAQR